MSIKENDVVFLLGAGCSFDAGIPTVNKMVEDIENSLLKNKDEWKGLQDLYFYIKSAILYADGIFGKFHNTVGIEKIMNVLSELEKKEKNLVYPFIANWNNRLIDLAGANFEGIRKLKKLITTQLINWIKLEDYRAADYYRHFYEFQKEVGKSIRVFTLNYDLCFEYAKPHGSELELGFDENRTWNSLRFDSNNQDIEAGIYLYKLHGSITWKRDKDQGHILKSSVHPEEEPDLIFGTDTKLQSIDPYLFYVYEFRKYTLESKIIIVIGYSFSDEYINNLIKQSLEHKPERVLIVVDIRQDEEKVKSEIQAALKLKSSSQIVIYSKSAKEFLENDLTVTEISKYLPKVEDAFL
ncbi:hypothetical protein HNQ34_003065 [Anoxybacillus tepidamans]|uniref:SIR2-like domain-containing protein n=1 Tax=Anoxybacteroides tepidamans TaxID=265948 RepID=A0A7W8IUK6_9BACL|nr:MULTISPECIES: SIR2 family protein [Bacillaceae]AMQ22085.1 hypothetical protein A0V43_15840 [Geobacillus sp. JS12]EMI10875.1 hypothetical protein F510_1004 [Anoxybacillus gonensis]MBB5325959.1 hypothetical protein [Anoxybacillus tepidamans]MCL6586128.1 SIR2 family protein [Anoxybacillus sp.]